MDKPNGPRQQPPDKRNTAYETIFGRPGVHHHQQGYPQNIQPPYPQFQPPQQAFPYRQQSHYSNPDSRTSFGSSYSNYQQYPPHMGQPPPPQLGPQPPQGPYRQPYPAPVVPQQPYSGFDYPATYSPSPPQVQTPYSYSGSLGLPSNPQLGRARSVISNGSGPIMGSPMSQYQEPPDAIQASSSQPSLTPAQAYQNQVYARHQPSPGPQPDWNRHRTPPAGQVHRRSSLAHGTARMSEPPRLGVSLEQDEGRLGLDFGVNGSGSSDQETDPDSELPYARDDHSDAPSRTHSRSKHTRAPSVADSTKAHRHLQVDTSSPNTPPGANPSISTEPATSATTDQSFTQYSPRPSSESSRTIFSNPNRTSKSMSISAASITSRSTAEQHHRKSSKHMLPSEPGRNSPAHPRLPRKKVYPALLSLVAEAFRERIMLSDRVKDGLTYKAVFDGREAVDKIAYIIKTTDRNLALLLGRALDAQKFFHDVTYDHRLRDSGNELYQFRTKLPSPFVSGELPNVGNREGEGLQHERLAQKLAGVDFSEDQSPRSPQDEGDSSDDVPLPSGVFTLLTDCYSPTCSRDRLCYSIACPRRLEQQARLNMKPQPGLSEQISGESLYDTPETGSLWVHSVPPEIVASVSDAEKKRQEAINEVIYTERDFVRDLEYLRDVWMKRLRDDDIIPIDRRADFLQQVFWNITDIIAVNTRLRDALNKRQKQYAVVEKIGDILLEHVPHFDPFLSYGAHQLWGKYEFEKEKNSNPIFAHFVELTERLPESRKLELNAYLTKPTTRLARYPLLLEAVLKNTPKDSPDNVHLPQVITMVRETLKKVNAESGKSENRFNLMQLQQQLLFKPGEEMDLRLADENREMVHKGTLNKRDGEIHVYLFDHSLLFTKLVKNKNHEQFKVYRPPIPLELLVVTAADDSQNASNSGTLRSRGKGQALVRRNSFGKEKVGVNLAAVRGEAKGQYWINFIHLGRRPYQLLLWASTPVAHRKWIDVIVKQQQIITEKGMVFETIALSEGFFSGPNKVNCAAPYNGGRRVVYGTDDGVYISDLREPHREPVKVLALLDVTQVDVLEDYQLLIVLSERQVITFPLDALDQNDPMAGLKRAKRISSHTSFFKAGFCLDKVLVCIVKSSQLSSTFKTLEPIDTNTRGRAKPTFKKLLQGGNDTLKIFREFYIPVESTSIHYLKTKLCVGCSKGFEIVDLETLDTQPLLDPHDELLEFVRRKEGLRPMAIYRIHNEFLLCYDEFAFYVNKNGRRSRKNFLVQWEGQPSGFALHEPFVLAFAPSFVEIRHVENGMLMQVIQGSNLRLLFADTPPSVTNTGGSMHYNPYPPGYNGYGPPHNQQYPGHNPLPLRHHPQGVGRDEILIVSDDRVLSLRPAPGAHAHHQAPGYAGSDTGSMTFPGHGHR